jgi:hypothetical protein
LVAAGFAACGPDAKPGPPCDGPTYNLVVRIENAPLPPDLRLNVRYGGNHEGEGYALGEKHTPQAVFCSEDTSQGGAGNEPTPSGGESNHEPEDAAASVWALRCRLYTQGPARIDVTATGYESIEEQDLTLADDERCRVEKIVELELLMDAGT